MIGGCRILPTTKQIPEDAPVPVQEETPRTTLPSPNKSREVEPRPSLEPEPPEVSYPEAIRQLKQVFPAHLLPLVIDQQFPVLLHDLNQDGQPEVFSIGILVSEAPDQLSLLSDYSRLYGDEPDLSFFLLCFRHEQGRYIRARTIDLGRWQVFESIRKMRVNTRRTLPVLVIVSFHTLEGRAEQLLVFDNASGRPVFTTLVEETLSTQTRLEDINEDGVLDLIQLERGMEEGTGYETFITWKRWTGRQFKEVRSTNVVRNLNTFLQTIKAHLLRGETAEVLRIALDPDLVSRLRDHGYADQNILATVFGLSNLPDDPLPEIREVIFPEYLEYPFTRRDEIGFYSPLTFRIVDQNGISYLADTYLYMLRNPFGERQFILAPGRDDQD
jgi:hypothetical protein